MQAGQPLLAAEAMGDAWDSQHDVATGQRRSVYLETYGCQMNVADSEVSARAGLAAFCGKTECCKYMHEGMLLTASGIRAPAAQT